MSRPAMREGQLGAFFESCRERVRWGVAVKVVAPEETVEDCCQAAWTILAGRPDVPLDERGVAWLVTVAARLVWRETAHGRREQPAGGWLPESEQPGELPEPAGPAVDPLERALERERLGERGLLLSVLTERERRFVALQAAGLSYREISACTGASARTVERQLLRAKGKLRTSGDAR